MTAIKLKSSKDVVRTSVQEQQKYVPKRVLAAAQECGWEVQPISRMWTRLKKDGVNVEVKYNHERRETRGRVYTNEVCLAAVLFSQQDVLDYLRNH